MPVPVTKYRCQFKCGTPAKASVKIAQKHENGCYKNPANKTCNTCSNEIYEREDGVCGRGCKIELINDFLDELQEKLKAPMSVVQHVKPLYNCPNWNKSDLQPATDQFLWDIRPKIELAASYREMAKRAVREPASEDGLPF
jgi:hypothetical protein